MLTFCSIVSPRTHAQSRVLAETLQLHHPDARMIAVVSGIEESDEPEPYETLSSDGSATVPELLAAVLGEADLAIYVDPCLCLYDTLEPILRLARNGGVAVVPRVTALPDDGQRPDDADLLEAGTFSSALVAVAGGEGSARFLSWWSSRLADSEVSAGRWLQLAVERFPEVAPVKDSGSNVGYWNLHERPLSRRGGQVLAGEAPLRFVDFAGFRPDRPYWLSEAATRVRVIDDPVLSELCGEYAQRLRAAGWTLPRRGMADIQRLGNGQRVDHLVRGLWEASSAEQRDFGDPLTAVAADEFVAWMRGLAPRGGDAGVNRYLLAAYLTRPDLQEAFPDLDGADGAGLINWAWEHGRREVLAELLPPVPGDEPGVDGDQIAVNVIGYLGETLGLAEAARLYIAALSAAGVPVSTTAITPDLPVKDNQRTITRYGSRAYDDLRASAEPVFNLACLNGDHLQELIRKRGEGVLEGRPTIGQWGWETDVLPPSWSGAFDFVDEVWVYSNFMGENLGRLLPMPVIVVPPAIIAPDTSGADLSIARDDRFTFLFMLDFFSTLRRKNALGLVDAFTRAFFPSEGPRLIVKTINARFRPEAAEELRFLVGDRSDVEFVDGYLEPQEKAALIARADCYVSLHSYLVDFTLTRVGPDSEIYPAHGTWAEPDLDHAAELMRRVWEHPDEAAGRAQRARTEIREHYAPGVVGRIARARLERLVDWRHSSALAKAPAAAGSLGLVEQALTFDLRSGVAPVPRGAAGAARKLLLRMMLPFTFHEREVDRAMLGALAELRSELGAERAARRRDQHRLRRLEATLSRAQRDD
jgi:hypothetical protein